VNIDWPGNHKPVDEPHCGYDGAKCTRGKGGTQIAAGVLGGILFFAIVLWLSVLKRWKQEQEIEGLLWKINPDCLQVGKSFFYASFFKTFVNFACNDHITK
jgi:guanylate cyclase